MSTTNTPASDTITYRFSGESRQDLVLSRAEELEREIARLIDSGAVDEATWGALDRMIDHWLKSALAWLAHEDAQRQAGLRAEHEKAKLRAQIAQSKVDRARAHLQDVQRRLSDSERALLAAVPTQDWDVPGSAASSIDIDLPTAPAR